jgi:O-antigen ligase
MLFKVSLSCIAAGMMFALWKSFSRGAWVGTVCGETYLLLRAGDVPLVKRVVLWVKRQATPSVVVIVCACVLLAFVGHQNVQNATLRRIVSVSNKEDFSWRNRAMAWRGALEMIADHPWIGVGWNQPDILYRCYYSKSGSGDGAAFHLNDYLTVGSILGIPAVVSFVGLIALSLRRSRFNEVLRECPSRSHDGSRLSVDTCQAAVAGMAVSMCFDGGLLFLPTATTFWTLLELARIP